MDFGKALLMQKIPNPRMIPSWILNFARSFTFRRESGRKSNFVSSEVFIFHLLMAIGIGSVGFDKMVTVRRRISNPCGARSSLPQHRHTNGIFFLQFFQRNIRNAIFINGLQKPSLFLKTTNATSPMSLILWTAPFTVTSFPSYSPAKMSWMPSVFFLSFLLNIP